MLTRLKRLTRTCALAAAVSVAAPGCAGPKSGQGAAAKQTAGRGGARDQFETTRDPPIASDTRWAAGQLAETRGAYTQAAEQYKQVLRDNPRHLQAMYRLGVVYAEMKKYPEAIDTWKRYAAATHDSAAAYSNLGFCYELAGRPEDAEATYQKAITKDPSHVASRVNYGLMLVRRGREAEGRLQLQAVLKPAEVHYNVGSVYESLGRREQARLEYTRALEADPSLADARARLDALDGRSDRRPAPSDNAGVSRTE